MKKISIFILFFLTFSLPSFAGRTGDGGQYVVENKTENTTILNDEIRKLRKSSSSLIDTVYPVGSIYISTVSTNPADLFGRGTWEAFGTGRCLVGIDTGQTEFDTVEETGGEKTHTLTIDEIPSHRHPVGYGAFGASDTNGYPEPPYNSAFGGWSSDNTNYAGGGSAHNNLQPYVTVYMFKRTE